MARDFKNTKRGGGTSSAKSGFVWGLVLGLAVAGGVHLYHLNFEKKQKSALIDAASPGKAEQRAPASQKTESPTQFDFYEALPKSQVIVPEKDKSTQRNSPSAHTDKTGTYVLQAGSYRNYADADRVRAQLALQGIESKINPVKIESETWNRVRIGPISDLRTLEDTRRKLREAQIDAYLVPVGD